MNSCWVMVHISMNKIQTETLNLKLCDFLLNSDADFNIKNHIPRNSHILFCRRCHNALPYYKQIWKAVVMSWTERCNKWFKPTQLDFTKDNALNWWKQFVLNFDVFSFCGVANYFHTEIYTRTVKIVSAISINEFSWPYFSVTFFKKDSCFCSNTLCTLTCRLLISQSNIRNNITLLWSHFVQCIVKNHEIWLFLYP